MSYLELIQRFWDFNNKNQIGSTGISMYLYLLKIGYENNVYDFHISDVMMSRELRLTRKTVKNTKEKLNYFGLIEFETKNGLPCYYRLVLEYPLQIFKPEKIENARIKICQILPKSENVEILSQESTPILCKTNIPSLKEFIHYAQTLYRYDSELEFSIKEKYEMWVANGWRNSSDRPITSWKSSLKSILPYLKNEDNDDSLLISSIPNIKRP